MTNEKWIQDTTFSWSAFLTTNPCTKSTTKIWCQIRIYFIRIEETWRIHITSATINEFKIRRRSNVNLKVTLTKGSSSSSSLENMIKTYVNDFYTYSYNHEEYRLRLYRITVQDQVFIWTDEKHEKYFEVSYNSNRWLNQNQLTRNLSWHIK